jgi:hypothetical protein
LATLQKLSAIIAPILFLLVSSFDSQERSAKMRGGRWRKYPLDIMSAQLVGDGRLINTIQSDFQFLFTSFKVSAVV